MSEYVKEKIEFIFTSKKLRRLKEAKEIFEKDVEKKVEMDEFIDMLVKAYLSYRNTRGTSESNLLQKMTEK